MNPEIIENENKAAQNRETSQERREDELKQGAELLENPPDGSFVMGLQSFVAWVKSLLASDGDK